MTGETISELLKPLIGKSGTIFLVVSRIGQIGFTTSESRKLTGVEVRPDGLVRLEREAGWTVIDPGEVVAVAWNGDQEHSAGQFLLSRQSLTYPAVTRVARCWLPPGNASAR